MDLYTDFQNDQPPSHYEMVVFKEDMTSFAQQTKHTAFHYMTQLEGWCTNNKAGVLIDLILTLNPKTIVEIGVWGGKSLVPMACALKANNNNGKIYGIDPWSNQASIEGMEGVNYDWWSKVDHVGILRGLIEKIFQFQLSNHIELVRSSSEDAPIIANIDMIHIDGNHSAETSMLDVTKWVPQVRKGGIIIFDDVGWAWDENSNAQAVEWLDAHCTRIATFQDSNQWAVWVKP
jgi:predicted O-methyltransferase YrrM